MLSSPSPGGVDTSGPLINPIPVKPQIESSAESGSAAKSETSARTPRPKAAAEKPEVASRTPPEAPPIPPVQVPHPEPSASDAPGIARYHLLGEKLAAGSQPTEQGFAWLKKDGIAAIVDFREPGEWEEDESKIVIDLGMKYLSRPVTPRTLTREKVTEFNEILTKPDLRPLYVHDSRGARAGAMWYLHLMTTGQTSEAEARRQAEEIGLKPDDANLWLAIDRLLQDWRKGSAGSGTATPVIPPAPKPSSSSDKAKDSSQTGGTALRGQSSPEVVPNREIPLSLGRSTNREENLSRAAIRPLAAALGGGMGILALCGFMGNRGRLPANRRAAERQSPAVRRGRGA